MLSRFGEWIRPRTPEPPVPPRIGVDESGFSIDRPDGDRTLVLWASVCRVVTFKYDNWAVDEIMLRFETVEQPGTVVEVSEQWPGFGDLFEPLERELGITPGWYQEVMHPAFATNSRVLFTRERTGVPAG